MQQCNHTLRLCSTEKMIFCEQVLPENRIVKSFSCESSNMFCYMLQTENSHLICTKNRFHSEGPPSTIISTTIEWLPWISVDSQWRYWWKMWVDWAGKSLTVWAQRWPPLSAASYKQQRVLWRHQRRDTITLCALLYAMIEFWRFAYAAWPCVWTREYYVMITLQQKYVLWFI